LLRELGRLTISILLIAHFLFFFRVLSPTWCWNPTLIPIVGIPELFVSYMALIIVLEARAISYQPGCARPLDAAHESSLR
jgi:hypothetical protein